MRAADLGNPNLALLGLLPEVKGFVCVCGGNSCNGGWGLVGSQWGWVVNTLFKHCRMNEYVLLQQQDVESV